MIKTYGKEIYINTYCIKVTEIIEYKGIIYLYYSGWSRGTDFPYSNFTGLAISRDGGNTFKKYQKTPILEKEPFEKYSATASYVYRQENLWNMWYGSGTYWLKINDDYEHTYDIKYAFSEDGLKWTQTNETMIKQHSKFEAITRPTVIIT